MRFEVVCSASPNRLEEMPCLLVNYTVGSKDIRLEGETYEPGAYAANSCERTQFALTQRPAPYR